MGDRSGAYDVGSQTKTYMKKIQLFIVVLLGFLCYSSILAADFPLIPSIANDFSDLGCSIHGTPLPVESSIADAFFICSHFVPDFDLHPHISVDIGTEDISLDTLIDTTDSTDDFEMKGHDESLTSPILKKIPSTTIRSIGLNTFNFPLEVSRLRI